jgi:hypothetical protein
MSRFSKTSRIQRPRAKQAIASRVKLKRLKSLAVSRAPKSGELQVERIGETLRVVRTRGDRSRSGDVRSVPARPTSVSSLTELSLKYGAALDRLAKR